MLPWLCVIALVVLGGGIAKRLPLPDAIICCVLGFGVGFVPGFEDLRLDPHLTLFLLLPPLVYASSVRLPWTEFRQNLRPISLLALGLVLVNTAVIAAVAHHLAGLRWPVAIALGAIISPTDPVAAGAVAARVGLPSKLIAILEGEGLVNDAVALTVLRLAIAALSGAVSVAGGVERFFAILIGEPIYGVLIAAAIFFLRTHIEDPRLEITVSLLTPFAAYLLPEHLGGSGILATVAAGMYVGERRSELVPAGTRLRATSVWEIVVFVLNGTLFVIAGSELRRVILPEFENRELVGWSLLIAAVTVALRAGWCAVAWFVVRSTSPARNSNMPARHMLVIAWAGMRGPISLAAVLSIPALTLGNPVPNFDRIIFITATVIVVTLIAQGIALPYVVRALGVANDAENERREEQHQTQEAQTELLRSAMERISQLQGEGRVSAELGDHFRRYYKDFLSDAVIQSDRGRELNRILISAQRARVQELAKEGRLSARVAENLDRQLDLRESALA